MSCGTTIRVLFSRALSHPKHSRPWLCRGRGCRGGKGGEDSHCKFNAGWKTGRPWLDFRQVATTTTDLDSPGNSVIVTAMFCKWCEMDGFKHNNLNFVSVRTIKGRSSTGANLGQTCSVDGRWRGVPEGEAGVRQGSRGICVFECNREGTSHTSSRVDGRLE